MKSKLILSAALISTLLAACQKYKVADPEEKEPEKVFVTVSDGSQTAVQQAPAATATKEEDLGEPNIVISDAPEFDFGSSFTPINKTFTLTNKGNATAVNLAGGKFSLPNSFAFAVNPVDKKSTFPGQGGTCTDELRVNRSCTVVVTFTPPSTTSEVQNDRLSVTYNVADDEPLTTTAIRIKGSFRIAANLTFSGQTNFNPNATLPLEQEIVLTNTGDEAARTLTVSIGGTNPSSFAINTASTATNRCILSPSTTPPATQLAKNARCSLYVRLVSATPISATANIVVAYDGGNGPLSLSIPVTTSSLVIQDPSGANGNFGGVYLTRSKTMEFTVRNAGSASTGSIGANALSSEFSYTTGSPQFSPTSCNLSAGIGANITCSLFVTYTPVASSASGTIRLFLNSNVNVPSTFAISGQRLTVANVVSNPASFDYGSTIFPSTRTFSFTNNGGTNTNIASPAITGSEFSFVGGSFPGTGANCTATNALNMNSANNCTVNIMYTPNFSSTTSATGSFGFNYNDGLASQTLNISLAGSNGYLGRVGPASNTSGSSFGSTQLGSRFNDDMGNTIAMDGNTLIVGAPKYRSGSGAAFIFAWDATVKEWQFVQMLSKNIPNSFYGANVGVSGSRVFVSSMSINSPINRRTAAQIYVYTKNGTTWGSELTLSTPTEVSNASTAGYLEFASSVAFNGNTIAAGAPNQGSADGFAGAGAVYVYTFNGTTWSTPAKVVTSARIAGARFGSSISISGSSMAVGAPYESSGAGAVYAFVLNSGIWTQQQKITPTGTNSWLAGDYFGSSVAINGTNLVVGSPYNSFDAAGANARSNAGAAYVFALASGTWSQRQKLVPSALYDRVVDGLFGLSVAIAGTKIIVGAPYNNLDGSGTNAISNAGAAFAYFTSNGGTSYTQATKLIGTGANMSRSAEDAFGYAVAIAPTTEHIGVVAPDFSYDPSGTTTYVRTGAVFMFK